ncbi:MAG: tryptophan transporter [Clostridium sp.]|nr:tryptophan transporter [Clostridium sp.]MBS4955540.1 tryptophan transporter [Clostridium sp.]
MKTNMNTKKMVINALLLAIGAILHQITPALGLPMQPDFALAMLFIIMIINNNDYKTSLISAIITGVFTALTTKFPGGQLPNIIDKLITVNLMYITLLTVNKTLKYININNNIKQNLLVIISFPLGTLISGTTFLLSAQYIVGLPAKFSILFVTTVIPALLINTIGGFIIYQTINISLKRIIRFN